MMHDRSKAIAAFIAALCFLGLLCAPGVTARAAPTAANPIEFTAQGVTQEGAPLYRIQVTDIFEQAYQSVNITYPAALSMKMPPGMEAVWAVSQSSGGDYITATFMIRADSRSADELKADLESLRFPLANPPDGFPPEGSAITLQASAARVTTFQDGDGYVHYYQFVPDKDINWLQAYNAAKNSTMPDPRDPTKPLQGYLATITSQEEQDKIFKDIATQCGWLGGTRMLYKDGKPILDEASVPGADGQFSEYFIANADNLPTGAETRWWYWADGPEAGRIFYTQPRRADEDAHTPDPATETAGNIPGGFSGWAYYANWDELEPNNNNRNPFADGPGGEYALQFGWSIYGEWNDYNHSNQTEIKGYYIEYGGYPGDPKADELAANPSSAELPMPVYVEYRAVVPGDPSAYALIEGIGTAWDYVLFAQSGEDGEAFTAVRNLPPEYADIPGYTPCGYAFVGDARDEEALAVDADGNVSGTFGLRAQRIVFLYQPEEAASPTPTPTPTLTPTPGTPRPTPTRPRPTPTQPPAAPSTVNPLPDVPGILWAPQYSVPYSPVTHRPAGAWRAPQTDDDSYSALWLAVLAACALGILGLVLLRARRGRTSQKLPSAILLAALCLAGTFAAAQVVTAQIRYAGARWAYGGLREYAPAAPPQGKVAAPEPAASPAEDAEAAVPDGAAVPADAASRTLGEINPDYAGWLRVSGTPIDYPVARGPDNDRYLSTTFTGESNPSGAVFMDFRCTEGFDAPLAILYGHNMKDGSMLAPLSHAAREGGEAPSEVAVTLPDGRTKIYGTFALLRMDAYDPVFSLPGEEEEALRQYCAELGAPEGCDVLALTTCAGGSDKDARVLLFAAHRP